MEDNIFDVTVIGAGIEGSATAYNLAKNGQNTLLLEQFPLPHTRGSSSGQSRIIRKAYTKDHFARMMPESYERWAILEKECEKRLFVNTGVLCYGRQSVTNERETMESTERALKLVQCDYEKLNAQQLKDRFKGFNFHDDHIGLLDKGAGLLVAHSALTAFQDMFKKFGGTLHDGAQVNEIVPGDVVLLRTRGGATYKTNKLIIAAGPWSEKLIKPLGIDVPLKTIRVTACYWRQKEDFCSVQSGCPAFINNGYIKASNGVDCHFFGTPAYEYENLTKVCAHNGISIDPDFRDVSDETWDVDALHTYVKDNMPYLEDKPSVVERCIYTMTPDENFFLDRHPQWKNIIIGAGFSGHGFKLAPVVGKILSELATDQKPSYDLEHFSLERFNTSAKL